MEISNKLILNVIIKAQLNNVNNSGLAVFSMLLGEYIKKQCN